MKSSPESLQPEITLVGYGCVGRSLALALRDAGANVRKVIVRSDTSQKRAESDGFPVTPDSEWKSLTNLLVLAVPDQSIGKLAERVASDPLLTKSAADLVLKSARPPVAMHLSGRYGIAVLEPLTRTGMTRLAFHPIQTFIHGSGAERFHNITVGVTADPEALNTAERLADLLGTRIWQVREKDRARYHHASVLASNFIPVLLSLAVDRLDGIAENPEQAVEGLLPLVRGMVENLATVSPGQAMSGPVVRGDFEAVRAHCDGWNEDKKSLYLELLRSAADLAVKSGRLDKAIADQFTRSIGQLKN